MLQEVFRIGSFPIYGYGVMMVIGFLAAVQLAKFLSRRSGLDPEIFVNAALIALIAGVAGARMSHVLENLPDYTRSDRSFFQNLFAMINIREGGLTFYGGLILAFPCVMYYGWKKKIPLRLGMDLVAPCVTLGLAFGRIGCFLNGCCYGAQCNLPWSVEFPYHSSAYIDEVYDGKITPPRELMIQDNGGERLLTKDELRTGKAVHRVKLLDGRMAEETVDVDPRAVALASQQHSLELHPAQLYSSFNSFLITAILIAFFSIRPPLGRVMALMLMLEGFTRYLLELVRAEPPVLGRMSLSMVLGILLVIVGAAMWFIFSSEEVAPRERAGVPVATA